MFEVICNLLDKEDNRVYIAKENNSLNILSDFDRTLVKKNIYIDSVEVIDKQIFLTFYNDFCCNDICCEDDYVTEVFTLDYYCSDPIEEYKKTSEIGSLIVSGCRNNCDFYDLNYNKFFS